MDRIVRVKDIRPMIDDTLFSVRGRRILLAGAGGLGAPIARMLAERGARMLLVDADPAALDGAPCEARAVADVTDEQALATACDGLGGAFDACVNAVGLLPVSSARAQPVEDFRRTIDVNLTGALLLSREAAARMPEGGSILHIASVSSRVANVGYAAYAASKAGLAQLVRVLAREWTPDRITVNALGPALVETPLTFGHLSDETFRANALAAIPAGRFCRPEDLFAMTLALLGPGGRFTTGQTIYVDGGRTIV